MRDYEIVITDVTCYGILYCVAGWHLTGGCMIRPEPADANATNEVSRFWNAHWVGPGKFFNVGNIVKFAASMPPQNFPFPHATEDRIYVSGDRSFSVEQLSLRQVTHAVRDGLSPTLGEAFGGNLIRTNSGKAYVAAGERTHSLDAIEVVPSQLSFYEDNPTPGKRRLRVTITENGMSYDLSVPAAAARTRFLSYGVAALQADARSSTLVHLRVGLCRPFSTMPDACYAQVNGLYFLRTS